MPCFPLYRERILETASETNSTFEEVKIFRILQNIKETVVHTCKSLYLIVENSAIESAVFLIKVN